KASGLRGRGGAGFPTATKWQAVRSHPCPTRYVVCNAAEGEPGTFKDRWLLRHNPYQVIEGLAVAALTVGAASGVLAVKRSFQRERRGLRRALAELAAAGLLDGVSLQVVAGPEEYLFGEEKALLEVVEGNDPLPRIFPPYQVGLFARRGSPNPTLVNNAETLANVPLILREGADRFREAGPAGCPGTMLFTVSGDVRRPGVYELAMGTPLSVLLEQAGGADEPLKAVFAGVSARPITPDRFGTPLDFESMRSIGSGLGSGGFIAYGSSTCIVKATLSLARFLWVESCAQCPACKHGAGAIVEALERVEGGAGTQADVDAVLAKCGSVTGGARCALPTGTSLTVGGALEAFADEVAAHLGRPCPWPRPVQLPKLADFDTETNQFSYDQRQTSKQPDWTYAEGGEAR
ncbi:MAG: SLBB domain-containing protein, partial [Actinomycetota bacterium]|nr:SLBB domain-containing protein [Actinomycetota bacterium]